MSSMILFTQKVLNKPKEVFISKNFIAQIVVLSLGVLFGRYIYAFKVLHHSSCMFKRKKYHNILCFK